MPYINISTNRTVDAEREVAVKAKLGRAIEDFPRKNESWLMIKIDDGTKMWFQGKDDPCAMVEVKIFGKGTPEAYDLMTKDVCTILKDELGIPSDRVYVRYDECFLWGWDNRNF